jgi:hypothetical protein
MVVITFCILGFHEFLSDVVLADVVLLTWSATILADVDLLSWHMFFSWI